MTLLLDTHVVLWWLQGSARLGSRRDPFDRMLVAQAQLEDLTIATSDRRIRAYDVPVLSAS